MNAGQIHTTVLKRAVTDNIDYPFADFRDILNNRVRALHAVSRFRWTFRETTFSTVANQFKYLLSIEDMDEIDYLRTGTTSGEKLTRMDEQKFFSLFPDPSAMASGSELQAYIPFESLSPVTLQPVAATTLTIESSDAADITQTVRLRIISGGYEDEVVATLNGTTPVSFGAKTATEIISVSKSAVTAGRVILKATGGATLVTISPGLMNPEYPKIGLYPIPQFVETITIGYYRKPIDIVNLDSTPFVPEKYHDILIEGCLADLLRYEDDAQGTAMAESKWTQGIQKIMRADKDPKDKVTGWGISSANAVSRAIRRGRYPRSAPDVERGI